MCSAISPGMTIFCSPRAEYNDTWTRDYGPLSVERGGRPRSLDFGFNGWGLKFASDCDNLVNLQLRDRFVIMHEQYRNERDFTLEGGSVESDGRGTLLTTTRCLTSPNRNGGKSKNELNEILTRGVSASPMCFGLITDTWPEMTRIPILTL